MQQLDSVLPCSNILIYNQLQIQKHRIQSFGQRIILWCDHMARVMGAQGNLDPVVDVRPFGMMIQFRYHPTRPLHKFHRRFK